ncbi:MAG: hypothetical protein AB1449_12230 [Chloroflexota bacterium]
MPVTSSQESNLFAVFVLFVFYVLGVLFPIVVSFTASAIDTIIIAIVNMTIVPR